MIKSYYVAADRITSRISADVIPGNHVRVDGLRFELVSKRPLGKSIHRKLIKEDQSEQLVLYK